jgi:hypothetical protein
VRYKLLAIDLDGTLIDHHGHVPEVNIAAITRARAAGCTVVLCTGRALIECERILDLVGRDDPAIVSGGAMVACPKSGQTLERFALEHALVQDVVGHLLERDHAAMVLKDPAATGYDYLVVSPRGNAGIDPASAWWFARMNVRLRVVPRLSDDEHPHDTIRVGAYQANDPVDTLATGLQNRFGQVSTLQHFQGVVLPKDRREGGVDSVHIVEVFHQHADKWQALSRLASRLGIDPAHTAAIGDQANDLTMLQHAGLGVAMGNAIKPVKDVAKRQTLPCEQGGVAHAIEQMLSGAW